MIATEEIRMTDTVMVLAAVIRAGDVIDVDGHPVTVIGVRHLADPDLVLLSYHGGSRSGILRRRPDTLIDRREVTG
jgi:hypothetical protein